MIPVLVMLVWLSPPQQARKTTKKHKPIHHTVHHETGISPQRAAQIQSALIKAGYLSKATGHWDAATAAAMKKYQADHHWQTRFVPDARALLALGLVQPISGLQTASASGNGN